MRTLAAAYDLSDTGRLRLDWQNGYAKYYNGAPNSYVLDSSGAAAFSGSVATGTNRRVTIDPSLFVAGNGMDDNSATMLTYTDRVASVDVVAKVGYQHENKWYTTVNANSGNYVTATGNVREFDTGHVVRGRAGNRGVRATDADGRIQREAECVRSGSVQRRFVSR